MGLRRICRRVIHRITIGSCNCNHYFLCLYRTLDSLNISCHRRLVKYRISHPEYLAFAALVAVVRSWNQSGCNCGNLCVFFMSDFPRTHVKHPQVSGPLYGPGRQGVGVWPDTDSGRPQVVTIAPFMQIVGKKSGNCARSARFSGPARC